MARGVFFKNARKTKEKEEQKVIAVLTQHSRKKKEEPKTRKRKSPDEMMELVPLVKNNEWAWVRDPYEWKSKSYNSNRQINDFAKWALCKYPIPHFMLSIFYVSGRPRMFKADNSETFFLWLLAIGQGQPFAKMAKGTLSKKEAHLFVQAPKHSTIVENIWWARCSNRCLPDGLTSYIVERFGRFSNFDDSFWVKTLDFFKQYQEYINVVTVQEIMDFLLPRHANDANFSLKGRTINSLIQLSNEWHRQQQATKHGKYVQWNGVDIDDWSWKDKFTKTRWFIKQIYDSKELYNEGRKMRHCVYAYVRNCVSGNAAIFTMESSSEFNDTEKHLTIEVTNNRNISQAKGKLNRQPNNAEHKVLIHWAQDQNLSINNWVSR